ncbi:MAG: hypothetical protein VR72_05990 [Clostridiaceae bacterium BRH_c20a]|nr:MAG: hypothetical protein VR72_05990 [Clostridiaceae bacterium BRH_c20a]
MAKHSFMQGAFILFLSGIFVKVIGFIFQITVIRIIGTEAVGLFNMVFPLYITVLVISTAGLPLAISKMVSQQVALGNYQGAFKIFRIALSVLIFLSFFFTIILFLISPLLINTLYQDHRVIWCFYTMIPGIIIVSICSAFRGFFQGLQEMIPPALTQCIEQIIRISLALFLITELQPYGIKMIAVGLSISMISGELVGLIIIYLIYRFKQKQIQHRATWMPSALNIPTRKVIAELFAFGFPTTLTRLISSLVLTFEASLIPLTLQKSGYTINQAASIYGQFSGVSISLLTIPTVLTFSLAISLVPAISEAEAQGKFAALQFRSTEALRLTYLFGLPVMIILILKATSLCTLLFNLPEAGTTVRYLAWGALFLYLAQTSNGILQGLGLVRKIFINTVFGSIIKVVGIIYLVAIPELNINGAAVAFVFSFFVVCILNLIVIFNTTGFHLNVKQIILPLMASLFMGVFIILETNYLTKYFIESSVTIISIITGGLFYFLLINFWGQINLKYMFTKAKK